MNPTSRTDRRQFVQQATAAAVLGASAASSPVTATAAEPALRPASKSKIGIGVRITPEWLMSDNDNDLRFLKQIGVDAVDIELIMVPGYAETGTFTRDALRQLMDRFAAVGLRIERANDLGPKFKNAHLGRPEAQRELDNLKRNAELMVAAEIPVYGVQVCQAALHTQQPKFGWTRKQDSRGGYDYPAFDLSASRAGTPPPDYAVTKEQLWAGQLAIYRAVVPIVDGTKTNLAVHGCDPPLYEHLGNPQVVCRFADFDRLFAEVPSKNSGITFCVGTRYESGEDVYAGLRHFGEAGKIFHVHFRNVRGTLSQGAYAEVMPDDGDVDMVRVVRILHEVGYQGVIDYDHLSRLRGDDPLGKQYIAFAVGHMRGILQSVGA